MREHEYMAHSDRNTNIFGFSVAGVNFKVERSRRRKRTVQLHFEDENTIVLIAPWHFDKERALEFAIRNIDKIRLLLDKHRSRKLENGKDAILYFGKPFKVVFSSEIVVPILFDTEHFVVNERYAKDIDILAKHWLRKRAEEYLPKRLKEISNVMGISYKKVQIRDVKTRWGSCSSKGTISLNWRLIMAPAEVIDYVLIHELAHIVHPNHSKAFWSFLASCFPQYKTCRMWLKDNGWTLLTRY
ncbi:M48 family peptidase [Fervidobacterium changbaicum]|uniref:M48 family peptidase n=2 Tax=Fervidobacterium changbaicum TaxID=310769 RepID=A0ABX5QTI2_9BACT|nr:M48 family peptidase [Fervidobacterium changbaicum]